MSKNDLKRVRNIEPRALSSRTSLQQLIELALNKVAAPFKEADTIYFQLPITYFSRIHTKRWFWRKLCFNKK
jgi:hypothetical protein